MSRLAITSWVLSSLGAAAVVVGIGVVPALGRGSDGMTRHPVLVESADCRHSADDQVGDSAHDVHRNSRQPSVGATQTISLVVPRTALIRLDDAGRVLAAWTNTGCAPSALDDVYVVTAAGAVVRSRTLNVSTFVWTGDFRTPGVYQAQQH